MNDKELVIQFFMEGYQNKNYGFVLQCLSENYIDHSPAGARSNQEAVNILIAVSKIHLCHDIVRDVVPDRPLLPRRQRIGDIAQIF